MSLKKRREEERRKEKKRKEKKRKEKRREEQREMGNFSPKGGTFQSCANLEIFFIFCVIKK